MLLYEGLEPIGRCCSIISCLDSVSLSKALFWPCFWPLPLPLAGGGALEKSVGWEERLTPLGSQSRDLGGGQGNIDLSLLAPAKVSKAKPKEAAKQEQQRQEAARKESRKQERLYLFRNRRDHPDYPDIDSSKTSQHTGVWRSGFNEYREGWSNPVTYGYWVRDNKGLLSMSMGFISGGRFNSLFDVGGGNNVKVINQTNPIIPPNPGENPFPRDGHDLAEEIKRLEGQIELTNIKASYSEANGFKGFYNSGDISGEISSGVHLIFEYNQKLNHENHIETGFAHVYGMLGNNMMIGDNEIGSIPVNVRIDPKTGMFQQNDVTVGKVGFTKNGINTLSLPGLTIKEGVIKGGFLQESTGPNESDLPNTIGGTVYIKNLSADGFENEVDLVGAFIAGKD